MTKAIKRSAAFLSAVAMVMAMLLYFPGGMFSTYFGLKASAEGITLTEPQKDGNGVYQIGTAEELYWFADKINNDNENYKSINVVLTKDIVVNENVLDAEGNLAGDTSGFTSWTPIGWSCWDDLMHQDVLYSYSGTFDGQGHTVSGLFFNNTAENIVGLFGVNSGTIQNVGVVDSYFNGR